MTNQNGFTDLSDVSYYLPDIIVESVLREAFMVTKRNPEIIDHVFRSLKGNAKYGRQAIESIKSNIQKYDWAFVQSFDEVDVNSPSISIQLLGEDEARETGLEDFQDDAEVALKPTELAALIVVPSFIPTGYDPISGFVRVSDLVDLSQVHRNLTFTDAAGNSWAVQMVVSNTSGSKAFLIDPGQTVDISGYCLIKSGIDYKQVTIRSTTTDVNLLIGVHTKNALLTKYFYILIKYFLMARKEVLIERGFFCSKFRGSDFTRDLRFQGDAMFTRYLTLTGKVQDSFRSDETEIFDSFNVIVEVPKDQATTQDLGLQNSTVQVSDTPQG